ncbi:DUF2507 domain-containing protein [Brevibacillus sp. GCM10020057]|uniref:DUF2507 domain-containing protein n=1 Tax=Brevibacillus sp. GCM10020057 TaxID=3317327 RepID=UPI003638805B
MKETDQLSALLPQESIAYAERMNMPYLGYHLLRETLTSALLGDSESAILYWLGKDIGQKIPVQSPADVILTFMRLGLGQLDIIDQSDRRIQYKLSHAIFPYMSEQRLGCALSLECGIIAGALERASGRETTAQLVLQGSRDIRIVVTS